VLERKIGAEYLPCYITHFVRFVENREGIGFQFFLFFHSSHLLFKQLAPQKESSSEEEQSGGVL
jgi:hypothetical protein